MERKVLDSCGKKRKRQAPTDGTSWGLGFLPAESKCLKRNGTNPLRKSNKKTTKYTKTA
jgi:hypothetical protein